MIKNYQQLAVIAWRIELVSYAALLLVFLLNTLVVPTCEREPNVVVWLLNSIPLLLFLPAIVKQQLRAHAWLCFLLLFYFLLAVPIAFSCTSGLTIFEVVAVAVLFVSVMLYIRWQSRARSDVDNNIAVQSE